MVVGRLEKDSQQLDPQLLNQMRQHPHSGIRPTSSEQQTKDDGLFADLSPVANTIEQERSVFAESFQSNLTKSNQLGREVSDYAESQSRRKQAENDGRDAILDLDNEISL